MPKHKILIIDYEPRGIKQLADPLIAAGFSVEIATDGMSGIKAFDTIKPDLTLIEAMLPKRHGFEVCQELKKTPHGRRSPVVIVTSVYKGRKYRSQALHHHGCDEYLEKPIPPASLVETVNRLLAGRATRPQESSAAASEAVHVDGDSTDTAEREILERLDSILPGDEGGPPTDSTPQARSYVQPRADIRVGDGNVVSFDPDGSRRRRGERVPAASPAMNVSSPAAAALETVPEPAVAPATRIEPEARTRRAANPSSAAPTNVPRTDGGWSVWILVGLLIALGVTVITVLF